MRTISPELITQTAAVALTAAILWTLHVEHDKPEPRPPANDPGIRLSLLQEAPAPEPPKVEPERPKPRETHVIRRAAAPAVAPDLPAPAPEDPPATDAPVVVAADPPAPAPAAAVSHANIEAAYAAALRQNIDARTAVPDTAAYRLLRPSGMAKIRFVLDRVGSPGEVSVASTSGSRILDAQALGIVSAGHYPPFPDAAYPRESRHTFIVTIEFRS